MIPLTQDAIRSLLADNDKAVGRALVALYRRQLEDERNTLSTLHRNGVGFNAADAGQGSRDAKLFYETGRLSGAQLDFWRTNGRIQKYAGQLLEIGMRRQAARMLEELAK